MKGGPGCAANSIFSLLVRTTGDQTRIRDMVQTPEIRKISKGLHLLYTGRKRDGGIQREEYDSIQDEIVVPRLL